MSTQAGPSQPRKKAGGSGKKGKIFLEDKSGLLSLISTLTDSKDAIIQSRIEKTKARTPLPDPATGANRSGGGAKGVDDGTRKKGMGNDKKRKEKERALLEAKEKIIQRQKEKKLRKKGIEPGSSQTASPSTKSSIKPKKKVGFA